MGSAWPVVKAIKRALDPNNVMNPGKQSFDEAYE
jgi:glycolate oxidase